MVKFNVNIDGVGRVNQEEGWVIAFDSASSAKLKSTLISEMRKEIEIHDTHMDDARRKACAWIDGLNLPAGMTVAFIMIDGYLQADRDIYSYMSKVMKNPVANDFVLMGYSSGAHTLRRFKDDSPMWGKIYVPEQDLVLLKNKNTSPLLMLDGWECSGGSYLGIGTALQTQLQYTGKIYKHVKPKYGVESIKQWDGDCSGTATRNPPIFTERGGPVVIDGLTVTYPKKESS